MVYEFYRQKVALLLTLLPAQIKREEYEELIPIERDRPFNTLLQKEILRYNQLIGVI